jgi:SulP family sulfate permease
MKSELIDIIKPKLLVYLEKNTYKLQDFIKDVLSGLSVAIVALPLAMAIAIASNLPPERGIFTAIVAGFLISTLGGSRYQIGGPTAAFIVTVSIVSSKHGYEGLVIASLMAGFILISASFLRAGELIKFIPFPVVTGFTSGIAFLILVSQLKDFFGLDIQNLPADFVEKLSLYIANIETTNIFAILIGTSSIIIMFYIKKNLPKIPSPIVVVVLSSLAVWLFQIPVDTIESKFGHIPAMLPSPSLPEVTFEKIRLLLPDAITIAILAGIESLLSAVVADGMTGTKHKPNTELLAQGIANIASSAFGGLPATGAIARTATNIKAGAVSPVSGIMHSIWLFLFIIVLAQFIAKVPLAALSAILIVVAYNMSEINHIKSILNAPKSDVFVLVTTFILTVFVDLNFAIQTGISLAALLFINSMMQSIKIQSINDDEETDDPDSITKKIVPPFVEVYEIKGPLFFGITEKFIDTLTKIEETPKVFVLRLRFVSMIDAAGLHALDVVNEELKKNGTTLVLSGVNKNVYEYICKSKLNDKIGNKNILDHIDKALGRARDIVLREQ